MEMMRRYSASAVISGFIAVLGLAPVDADEAKPVSSAELSRILAAGYTADGVSTGGQWGRSTWKEEVSPGGEISYARADGNLWTEFYKGSCDAVSGQDGKGILSCTYVGEEGGSSVKGYVVRRGSTKFDWIITQSSENANTRGKITTNQAID